MGSVCLGCLEVCLRVWSLIGGVEEKNLRYGIKLTFLFLFTVGEVVTVKVINDQSIPQELPHRFLTQLVDIVKCDYILPIERNLKNGLERRRRREEIGVFS